MSSTSGGSEGGGGGGLHPSQILSQHVTTNPDHLSMTSAWAVGGVTGGINRTTQRAFSKIIEEEKSNRNILEIQIVKIITDNEKPRPLTYDDL